MISKAVNLNFDSLNPIRSYIWSQRLRSLPQVETKYSYSFYRTYPVSDRDKVYQVLDEEIFEKGWNLLFLDQSDADHDSSASTFVCWLTNKIKEVDIIAAVSLDYNSVSIWSASSSQFLARKAFREVEWRIDAALSNLAEDLVAVRMSWMNEYRDTSFAITNISCPNLSDIIDNYSRQTTRKQIEEFFHTIDNNEGAGKLAIWYGPPGTGKTWMVKSLIRHLKNRYVPIYITDPDIFMGDSSYYYKVINGHNRPILFILEDAAEGIIAETRSTNGGKIGRMLNLTDGFAAQGRKDLFLVTFNEDLKRIDDAIIRPGRCLGTVYFSPLDKEESALWLSQNAQEVWDEKDLLHDRYTLAELYGLIRGDSFRNDKVVNYNDKGRIGFQIEYSE